MLEHRITTSMTIADKLTQMIFELNERVRELEERVNGIVEHSPPPVYTNDFKRIKKDPTIDWSNY